MTKTFDFGQKHEMQLYSGKMFQPGDMTPDMVDIRDVGAALSKICRFGGHTLRFYSVAEHSILVSKLVMRHTNNKELALHGLLHDAHEAYIGDFPSPLKKRFPELKTISNQAEQAVYKALGLPKKLDPIIKQCDLEALALEVRQNMARPVYEFEDWAHLPETPYVFALEFLLPVEAEKRFLRRYRDLRREVE